MEQQKLSAKQQLDQQKVALLEEKLGSELQIDTAELQLEQQKLALDQQELAMKAAQEDKKLDASQELEGLKLGRDIAKDTDKDTDSE